MSDEPADHGATYVVEILVTDHEPHVEDFWEEWGRYDYPDEAVSALQYLRPKGVQTRWAREARE